MTPALLRAIGEALHGRQWITPLSRDLGVADRTVERWAAGKFNIPADKAAELGALLKAKRVRIDQLLAKL